MKERSQFNFRARWLRFDPQRPTRPRLLGRFVIAMVGMLLACAMLAHFTR